MVSDKEFEEMKREVEELGRDVQQLKRIVLEQNKYIEQILREIPEIPERGMARFDAATWESPSAIHTVFMMVEECAESSPDGYATRGEVKERLSTEDGMLQSKVKEHLGRLSDEDMLEERPGDDSRIRPAENVRGHEVLELSMSNFERADRRREKAEDRGKSRDRPR